MTEYGGSGDPRRSLELLWRGRETSGRGPKPRLSVTQITRAAIGLADTEGLAAVSMRRVAEQVGVTGMSLYTYVPGKSELLDLMVDAVYGEAADPCGVDGDWRAGIEAVARSNWALYLRHPWLLQVATSRSVLGPNLIAKYDHELRPLAGSGLTEVEMDLVLGVVGSYVHGAVRSAVDVAEGERSTGMTDDQWWQAHAPVLEEVFDPQRYPMAAAVGAASGQEYGAAVAPERAFEFGLQLLLDGLAGLLASRSGR